MHIHEMITVYMRYIQINGNIKDIFLIYVIQSV